MDFLNSKKIQFSLELIFILSALFSFIFPFIETEPVVMLAPFINLIPGLLLLDKSIRTGNKRMLGIVVLGSIIMLAYGVFVYWVFSIPS